MTYIFRVNMLVEAVVFGSADPFILALFAWTEAKDLYKGITRNTAHRRACRRESFTISRANSRNPNPDSFRAE